jgi:ABC-type sugar transport system ATPase subunit
LEDLDAGEVRIGGERVDRLPPHRRGVGLVPQRPALYPHLTVAGNLGGDDARRRLAANLLNITPLLDRMPHQLSGGERQRVALAKLVARNAAVWLLDEPFTGLDPVFRPEFRHDLHLLRAERGVTMILVTHDPADAFTLGHRIGVLGDGVLQQVGTPDRLRNSPDTRFVAAALGRLSLIDGTLAGRAGGGDLSGRFVSECGSVSVPVPAEILRKLGTESAPSLTLGIRPEDVQPVPSGESPASQGALTQWSVVSAEPDGSGWWLTLARGRTRVRAKHPSGPPPGFGTPADWVFPADRCLWFDGKNGRRIGD